MPGSMKSCITWISSPRPTLTCARSAAGRTDLPIVAFQLCRARGSARGTTRAQCGHRRAFLAGGGSGTGFYAHYEKGLRDGEQRLANASLQGAVALLEGELPDDSGPG